MSELSIVAVRKDKNGVITHVKTTAIIDGKTVSGGERTKQEVIHNITNRKQDMCYTVPGGAKVHVVDGKYIRSDGNDTKADNLGELPTF